jgi:uncharacterized protein
MSIVRFKLLVFCGLWFCVQAVVGQLNFYDQLAQAALTLTQKQVVYDPAYYRIDYPNGDVPSNRGVCTDVVIRAYRLLGIDLQQLVHEDMRKHFHLYPKNWGLTRPDKNIDHRRVPNLMVFFKRHGTVLPNSINMADYQPGHIVVWDLGRGLTHIGIVVKQPNQQDHKPVIVHNIGNGQEVTDCLFSWPVIGHYCYKR